jgi:hypothetical protein
MENVMSNNVQNFKKIIINFYVTFFITVIGLIVLLIVSYYLTPNNYETIKLSSDKFYIDNIKEYEIKPNSNITIKNSDLIGRYIGFDKEINLFVQNLIKSQNIVYMADELIFVKFSSDIVILNSTDKTIHLTAKFYKK